ncbi:MAG: transglycosylase SLT domain-containing protein [Anaerolineales bacterium]
MRTLKTLLNYLLPVVLLLTACQNRQHDLQEDLTQDSLNTNNGQSAEQNLRLLEIKQQLESSRYNKSLLKYSPVIKKYAKRYGFDWRLIVAQIMQESKFREHARSPVGARGLMQLMPGTEREISRELDFQYILKNPRENIAAGIYHLKKQYNLFDQASYQNRIKLSLAAYNCGSGRVFDAQDITRYYKFSPQQWKYVKIYLAYLKSSDWKLHLQVWPQGRPNYGYFYGYNETIAYVDNIWEMYAIYQQLF